jgi:hypothetical protein
MLAIPRRAYLETLGQNSGLLMLALVTFVVVYTVQRLATK